MDRFKRSDLDINYNIIAEKGDEISKAYISADKMPLELEIEEEKEKFKIENERMKKNCQSVPEKRQITKRLKNKQEKNIEAEVFDERLCVDKDDEENDINSVFVLNAAEKHLNSKTSNSVKTFKNTHGLFKEAIDTVTEEIDQAPNDYRLYHKRCLYCIQIREYKKALKDAEDCTKCNPDYYDGYVCMGEAYLGLNEFQLAADAFKQALKLNPQSQKEISSILYIQLKKLMDMGFTKESASLALRNLISLNVAFEFLLRTPSDKCEQHNADECQCVGNAGSINVQSNDDIFNIAIRKRNYEEIGEAASIVSSDAESVNTVDKNDKINPFRDFGNPLHCCKLYISNVSPPINKKYLELIFSRYGDLKSTKLLTSAKCALVTFKDWSHARNAMFGLHNSRLLPGTPPVIIKYPPSVLKKLFEEKEETKSDQIGSYNNNAETDNWCRQRMAPPEPVLHSSTFVSNAAEKTVNSNFKETEQTQETLQNLPSTTLHTVKVLALKGFNLAIDGHLIEAIFAFTEAIDLAPKHYRLYHNRCLCYNQIREYEKALKDAEDCIKLNPDYSNGYVILGEVYLGLNDLHSGDNAFEQAINLHFKSQEVISCIFYIKLKKLMDLGFPKERASLALQKLKSLKAAIEFLLRNLCEKFDKDNAEECQFVGNAGSKNVQSNDDFFNIAISNRNNDEESEAPSIVNSNEGYEGSASDIDVNDANDPYMDCNNPYHCCKIYIKDVTPHITKKFLKKTFSRYGHVRSIRLLHDNTAFVTYKNWRSAGIAMEKLQNSSLMPGTPCISIIYPMTVLRVLSGGLVFGYDFNKLYYSHQSRSTIGNADSINNAITTSQHQVAVLALKGFNLSKDGHFKEAIHAFTEAIVLAPNDYRLYNNRCICYTQIGKYHKAIEDAELCIKVNPDYSKGYVSKGETCLALNDFDSAEDAFEQAIKRHLECQDVISSIFYIQLKKLVDMGFPEKDASLALKGIKSLNETYKYLRHNPSKKCEQEKEDTCKFLGNDGSNTFNSDDDNYNNATSNRNVSETSEAASIVCLTEESEYIKTIENDTIDPYMDCTNPYHCRKIYIGNLSTRISQKYLKKTFSRYGQVLTTNLLPNSEGAFVTYKNWRSAGIAMNKHQNSSLMPETPPVIIKYPTNILQKLSGGLLLECDIRQKSKIDQIRSFNVNPETDNSSTQTTVPPQPDSSLTSNELNSSDVVLNSSTIVSNTAGTPLNSNKHSLVKNDFHEKKQPQETHQHLPPESQHLFSDFAIKGYNLEKDGLFKDAIDVYTAAIDIAPKKYMLYNKRCHCYIEISEYQNALKDAEDCTKLNPDYADGYMSMGDAYLGLNDLKSAENAYEQALKLNPKHEKATFSIQLMKLLDMGFPKQRASMALHVMKSFNAALELLIRTPSNTRKLENGAEPVGNNGSEVYHSDNDKFFNSAISNRNDNEISKVSSIHCSTKESECTGTTENSTMNPYTDYRNPYHCCKIYIGNVSPLINLKYLEQIFSRYGHVTFTNLIPSDKCAFLIYKNWRSAGISMEKLQNSSLMPGTPPVIIQYQTTELQTLSGGFLLRYYKRPNTKTNQIRSYNNNAERHNSCRQTMTQDSPAPSLTSVGLSYSEAALHSSQKNTTSTSRNMETNQFSCGSLHIGNILKDVTDTELTRIFSKYGKIVSVRLIPEKKCAFVNFANNNHAALAMDKLQGKTIVPGCPPIVINYPFKATRTIDPNDNKVEKTDGQVLGGDCYKWQTLGCNLGKKCPNKHLPEQCGIFLRYKTKRAT